MKQLIKKFKQISILILAIFVVGCELDQAGLPKVVAGFTYTLDADTGTVTFINISENANTYVWDFGDDTGTTEINPVKNYPTGTYTVTLTAKNVAGASETFEDTITINIPLPMSLPITFDVANVNYNVGTFEGTSFAIVDNPAPGGTNNVASKVGAITNSGKAFEGVTFDLGTDIDLATEKTIKINFWADAPVNVLMKLEKGTASTPDIIVSHGGTGWEEMSFNFSASNKYSRVTLFVDGPGTTAGTFYMDDVTQIETPLPPCTPEIAQSLSAEDFNVTFQAENTTANIVDDGATMIRVLNPDTDNTLNTSCQVGQITRSPDFQYANNQFNFATNLDFNTNAGFKIKVWTPAVGTNLTVKLEGGVVTEVSKATTKANEWEELTFDFASSVTGNNKIVLFFNINSNTTGTFYIDDLKLYPRTGGGGSCIADAAQSLSASNFNMTMATDPSASVISDGAGFTWVDNPDFNNGVNTSCKVGKVVKGGNFPWDNNQIDLNAKLDFNTNTGLKIKVWSSRANTEVRIKLEEIGNAGNNIEKFQTTSVTNGWEELTFAYTSTDSGKFNKIVIFFDLNANNTDTYYFDDLMLYGTGSGSGGGGGGTGTCPAPPAGELLANGNFEAGDVGCWQFLNGTSISTTINNGGSKSGQLTGKTGQAVGLKQERFAVGSILPNTSYTVSFDIKASAAFNDGAVLKAFTFSEGPDGGSVGATLHTLTDNTSSVSTTTWESKTYTFTTPGNANQVAGGISFLIELVNSSVNVNVDNVVIKRTP